MSHETLSEWQLEPDQKLLNRHRDGNVIGIPGFTYWAKMETLRDYLKERNLI